MVHYAPRKAAQNPPPLCPKCGSHRTSIVGISDELRLVFIRCSACGHSSQVPLGADQPDPTSAPR